MAENTMADFNENDYPTEATIGDQSLRTSTETGWKSKAGSSIPPAKLHRYISRVAYELYLRRGRVDGHGLEDWLAAEAMVQSRRPPTETPIGDYARGK